MGGIVEAVDADADLILSTGNYGPSAARFGSPVPTIWGHGLGARGTVPRRWDVGGALATWSGGVPAGVDREAVKALTAGYVKSADVPRPLDLGTFSPAVTAHLNWIGPRINLVFENGVDTERREVAARAVPALLADPPTRQHFEAILDALG